MARDYEQFEYFGKMFKGEVDETQKLRNEARKERALDKDDEEIKEELDKDLDEARAFVKDSEEEWEVGEVDLEKLQAKIEEGKK